MNVRDILRTRDRFWLKAAPPDARGCRIWQGSTYPARRGAGEYPQFAVRHNQNVRGHRFAWVAAGKTPAEIASRLKRIRGLCVRHLRCDVTLCVEPKHLKPGTCQDNSNDAKRRGRVPRGTRHYASKMTPQKLLLLKRMAADGVPYSNLSKAFGMHPSNISRAVRGRSYVGGV